MEEKKKGSDWRLSLVKSSILHYGNHDSDISDVLLGNVVKLKKREK